MTQPDRLVQIAPPDHTETLAMTLSDDLADGCVEVPAHLVEACRAARAAADRAEKALLAWLHVHATPVIDSDTREVLEDGTDRW